MYSYSIERDRFRRIIALDQCISAKQKRGCNTKFLEMQLADLCKLYQSELHIEPEDQ